MVGRLILLYPSKPFGTSNWGCVHLESVAGLQVIDLTCQKQRSCANAFPSHTPTCSVKKPKNRCIYSKSVFCLTWFLFLLSYLKFFLSFPFSFLFFSSRPRACLDSRFLEQINNSNNSTLKFLLMLIKLK